MILFIFLDGFGVGGINPHNPFVTLGSPLFPQALSLGGVAPLPFSGKMKAIDATLGVPGTPQSATGQSSLFTGLNTAKMLGHHLSAFPNQEIRKLIANGNLLKDYRQSGGNSFFFNAYPNVCDYLNTGAFQLLSDGTIYSKERSVLENRVSVTTAMALSIGQKFTGMNEIKNREALYQDFSNEKLIEHYPEAPLLSPEEAGAILAKSARENTLLLYEYFITDQIGHKATLARSIEELQKVERFLLSILEKVDLKRTTVIVTSDHGNIEDAGSGSHTENPVPFLVWGPNCDKYVAGIDSILDVTPVILRG